MAKRQPDPTTVYLICFDRPYAHARHYIGSTADLPRRLAQHQGGTFASKASRLMEVVHQAGISWQVTRTWEAGKDFDSTEGLRFEQRLKRRRQACSLCPRCARDRNQRAAASMQRTRDRRKTAPEQASSLPVPTPHDDDVPW